MAQSEKKKLLLHKDLEDSPKLQKSLRTNSFKKKNYFLEQLLIYGSNLAQTKSVSGKAKGWYRLPLGGGSNGKDKYLWYAAGDRGIGKKLGLKSNEILVRSIRDHDDTKFDLNPGVKKNWIEVEIEEFDKNLKHNRNYCNNNLCQKRLIIIQLLRLHGYQGVYVIGMM